MRRPLLLGHRGLRSQSGPPENSIAAFEQALLAGCDGFEFDVRRTADGQSVICHDPRHKQFDISRAQRSELSDLATLDDVLSRFATSAFLDIELKVPGLEESTIESLRRFPSGTNPVISSFLPEVLLQLATRNATLTLGLICERRAELDRWKELPVGYVIPHISLLSPALLTELHEAGKNVIVWTVNREDEMRQYADWGVDGIVSDAPERLAKTVRQLRS